MKPKSLERRLMSERRKEIRKMKSKEAARCRRSKETLVFEELIDALPVADVIKSTLDKTSLIRLCIQYMKTRHFVQNIWQSDLQEDYDDEVHIKEMLNSFHGFVLVVTCSGEIVYCSENSKKWVGLSQYDVIGSHISELTHPCDQSDIESNLQSHDEYVQFISRFKNTLMPKGRMVNLKSATYKVLKFCGHRLSCDVKPTFVENEMSGLETLTECVMLTATPIIHPEQPDFMLDSTTFSTRHNLDMKITDVDDPERGRELVKYSTEDLVGCSFYNLIHAADLKSVSATFKPLVSKGQTITSPYDMLVSGGGYRKVVTQATVIQNQKTNKPDHVSCVHHFIGGIEEKDLILSEIQISASTVEVVKVKVEANTRIGNSAPICDTYALTASMFDSDDVPSIHNKSETPDILETTAGMFDDGMDFPSVNGSAADEIMALSASMFDDDSPTKDNELAEFVERLDDKQFLIGTDDSDSSLIVDTTGLDAFGDEEEFYMRAPYIPMNTADDVFLMDGLNGLTPFNQTSDPPINNTKDQMSDSDAEMIPRVQFDALCDFPMSSNGSVYSSPGSYHGVKRKADAECDIIPERNPRLDPEFIQIDEPVETENQARKQQEFFRAMFDHPNYTNHATFIFPSNAQRKHRMDLNRMGLAHQWNTRPPADRLTDDGYSQRNEGAISKSIANMNPAKTEMNEYLYESSTNVSFRQLLSEDEMSQGFMSVPQNTDSNGIRKVDLNSDCCSSRNGSVVKDERNRPPISVLKSLLLSPSNQLAGLM